MTLRIFKPTKKGLREAAHMAETGVYPPEIAALKNKIEAEIKLSAFFMANAGGEHPAHVQYIVDLKRELDGLYIKYLTDVGPINTSAN
ncbi:MAG TPA: hypothetical protein PKD79_00025 [Candidatus Doudnabacteria bacterium]|nr:hypothetical protein [Candidatus Doudnabacteria bacterium]